MTIEKRHKCTKCGKKRKEKFMVSIREGNRPGSKVWICSPKCQDGRLSVVARKDSPGDHKDSPLDKYDIPFIENLTKSYSPGRKIILDVCCGNRMMWFDKKNKNTVYADIKDCGDIKQDFRKMILPDNHFKLVVFDPPHLIDRKYNNEWMKEKYGTLHPEHWTYDLRLGFKECMRVLDNFGVLILKWNEINISVSTILHILSEKPLFGHTSDSKKRTHWLCYMKLDDETSKPQHETVISAEGTVQSCSSKGENK